jgi:hypothetical protein
MKSAGGSTSGRLSALLQLQSNEDGSIAVTVTSPHDDERLSVDDAALVLTLWAESANVLRGSFVDQASGVVAYFQTTDASLQQLARTIKLAITS